MSLEEIPLVSDPAPSFWADAGLASVRPTLPPESFSLGGRTKKPNGRRLGIVVRHFKLKYEKKLLIRITCRGCAKHERVSHGIVGIRSLLNQFIPNKATLIVRVTSPHEIGRYLEILNAGTESGYLREPQLCLLSKTSQPEECEEEKDSKAKERQEIRKREEAADRVSTEQSERETKEREIKEKAEREAEERKSKEQQETKERLEREERKAKENEVITSFDNTKRDLAPYEGALEVASQQFTAESDRITYAGVTIGDPELPVGPTTYTVTIQLCATPACSGTGTVLASASALVNNYALTSVQFGEVAVTEGHTYYLVWTPPAEIAGSPWLTLWHGGTGDQMEAVVRGYDHADGSGYPFKGEIASYLGTQAPPSPYAVPFDEVYQHFEAASNRITKLGVVLANPKLAHGEVGPEKVKISLCDAPRCETGVLASSEPPVVNYGITEARIPAVSVLPGEMYYLKWQSPAPYQDEPWTTYRFGAGQGPDEAAVMQAFVKGYDEASLTFSPSYFLEQPEEPGNIETFKNYEDASGNGPGIRSEETVEVTCKVFSPSVEWSEPEGYWYRIHSEPWDDEYYAAANEFQNTTGSAIPTDPNVPDC